MKTVYALVNGTWRGDATASEVVSSPALVCYVSAGEEIGEPWSWIVNGRIGTAGLPSEAMRAAERALEGNA